MESYKIYNIDKLSIKREGNIVNGNIIFNEIVGEDTNNLIKIENECDNNNKCNISNEKLLCEKFYNHCAKNKIKECEKDEEKVKEYLNIIDGSELFYIHRNYMSNNINNIYLKTEECNNLDKKLSYILNNMLPNNILIHRHLLDYTGKK